MQTLLIVTGLLSVLTAYTSGYTPYNSSISVCCDGEVFTSDDPHKLNSLSCCYKDDGTSEPYNYRTHTCCDGTLVQNPGNAHYYGCCNGELYRYETHMCCGTNLYELSGDNDESCCDDQLYKYSEQVCCSEYDTESKKYVEKLYADVDNNARCCGLNTYDSTTSACCNDAVTEIPSDTFDGDASVDCCNGELYDMNTHLCCTEWQENEETGEWEIHAHQVISIEGNRSSCCGLQAYDYNDEVCCSDDEGYTIVPKPEDVSQSYYPECCGKQLITDGDTQLCHNEQIVERENSYFWMCGDELYDSRVDDCCGDKTKFSYETQSCCWSTGEVYDVKTQLCCESGVVDKTEEDITLGNDLCCDVSNASEEEEDEEEEEEGGGEEESQEGAQEESQEGAQEEES